MAPRTGRRADIDERLDAGRLQQVRQLDLPESAVPDGEQLRLSAHCTLPTWACLPGTGPSINAK